MEGIGRYFSSRMGIVGRIGSDRRLGDNNLNIKGGKCVRTDPENTHSRFCNSV